MPDSADPDKEEAHISLLFRGMPVGAMIGCLAAQSGLLFFVLYFNHYVAWFDTATEFICYHDQFFNVTPAGAFLGSVLGGLLSRQPPSTLVSN